MGNLLKNYLKDPFLGDLYTRVRNAGAIRSISVDITHICNLRCTGCYYFSEGMDQLPEPPTEAEFDAFIQREKARGTNFVTVVGGEPSLVLHRLKKIYDNFWMSVATNGLRKIPYQGFENLPIGISVWGDHRTDKTLRGNHKIDVFEKALRNYHHDPRAFWYYTVTPGNADEIESVVEQCVRNGNYVLFNFYGDLNHYGGALDYRTGFDEVNREIKRMIDKYPDRILITSYLSQVVTSGQLYEEKWGYEVCTSLSANNPINAERFRNGKPYNRHFRAYNADFKTTRRCCTGIDRDCDSCFDVWEHFSWIMLNFKKHLKTKQEFTNWLTTMYLFYLINRIIDFEEGIRLLPEIHRRVNVADYAIEKLYVQ